VENFMILINNNYGCGKILWFFHRFSTGRHLQNNQSNKRISHFPQFPQ
jgi:hypothetical protein